MKICTVLFKNNKRCSNINSVSLLIEHNEGKITQPNRLESFNRCKIMFQVIEIIILIVGILFFVDILQGSRILVDEKVAQRDPAVVEKQKELESVLDELNRVAKETRDAEEAATSRRNSVEAALADYHKLKASQLNNLSKESALEASFTLRNIMAAEDEIDSYDRKVFELKSLTSQLKKKLLRTENELANAQIQYIALHDNASKTLNKSERHKS